MANNREDLEHKDDVEYLEDDNDEEYLEDPDNKGFLDNNANARGDNGTTTLADITRRSNCRTCTSCKDITHTKRTR
jgi:hypothetical protein